MGQYYHSFRENADLKLFVKSLLETIFGKLIVEREICLNHLESSQELQLIYSKAFSVSLPHIARTLYFRLQIGVENRRNRYFLREQSIARENHLDAHCHRLLEILRGLQWEV